VYRSTDVCIENWVQDAYSCYNAFNYTITYHDTSNCSTTNDLPANNGTVANCTILYPNATNFDGVTSYFNDKTQAGLETFNGLVLENTTNGKIEWNGVTNVSAQNFDAYVTIAHNFVNVDSANLHPSINSPANISLYNLNITSPWV
jgi:predicted RNA-binding protein with PUA-like domain